MQSGLKSKASRFHPNFIKYVLVLKITSLADLAVSVKESDD